MNPPKCCGVCANWTLIGHPVRSSLEKGTELYGACPLSFGGTTQHSHGSQCKAFVPLRFVVAPDLDWKRDCDGLWFVRCGDVELTVRYNIDVERWEWCAGMAVDEWVECERGLRKTRAGAMRAAEARVERVMRVLGNVG